MTPILFVCAAGPEREVYVRELADAGLVTVVAEDTADATDKFKDLPTPELAVLDLLPRPDLAWALAERLAPSTAVIILTSLIRPDRANRQTARRLGCAAFIAKPCSPRQLLDVVLRVRNGERGLEITTYSA